MFVYDYIVPLQSFSKMTYVFYMHTTHHCTRMLWKVYVLKVLGAVKIGFAPDHYNSNNGPSPALPLVRIEPFATYSKVGIPLVETPRPALVIIGA